MTLRAATGLALWCHARFPFFRKRMPAQLGFQISQLRFTSKPESRDIYVYAVNRMTLRAIFRLIVVLACAVAASSAQTSTQFTSIVTHPASSNSRQFLANDPHIQSQTLGKLYANSAFAHGYRHGYEQGFHVGDLDIHMGRDARIATKSREYSQANRDYRPGFGSKQLFEDGYQAGFRGGYADAISGGEFRASARSQAANAGLAEVLPSTRRAHFDDGVAAGYKSSESPNAPAANVTAEYVERHCRETVRDVYSLEYCSGFGRGYMLGISSRPSDSITLASSKK
jgi:hypothetical protein